jgi:hypothetical protein
MSEQQTIPVPEIQNRPRFCAWCGEPATTAIELEPAQHTFKQGPDGKRVKLIKRHAIEAPVCAFHFSNLERGAA